MSHQDSNDNDDDELPARAKPVGTTTRREKPQHHHHHPDDGNGVKRKQRKAKPTNPLQAGILNFLDLSSLPSSTKPSSSSPSSRTALSISALPKRYTLYPPLLLLPANFGTVSREWGEIFSSLIASEDEDGDGGGDGDGDADGDRTEEKGVWTWRRRRSSLLLWKCIAEAFGRTDGSDKLKVTHIAISAPIERDLDVCDEGEGGGQNITRAPSNLRPVYGDFGPDRLLHSPCPTDLHENVNGNEGEEIVTATATATALAKDGPQKADFAAAFWASTSIPVPSGSGRAQGGVVQVWAPRWTMFSRGNIREKNRILLGSMEQTLEGKGKTTGVWFPGLTEMELREPLGSVDVVDFYVGIGYFAFCYIAGPPPLRPRAEDEGHSTKARLGDGGVNRVWGWDVNGWSIEGLRRGCERNGWRSVVVKLVEDDNTGELRGLVLLNENAGEGEKEERSTADIQSGIERLVGRIALGDQEGGESRIRCVAFWGDNKFAPEILHRVGRQMNKTKGKINHLNIRHANLGLLPSSKLSWNGAVQVLNQTKGGWLHVHENVDVRQIGEQSSVFVREIRELVKQDRDGEWRVNCDHIEQVKTYAPGVMHCVFDICISPAH